MRSPALQFPLVWAAYLLIWICGILAVVWPGPGITAACLLLAADKRMWKAPRLAACLLIFCAAFFYAGWRIGDLERSIAGAPAWTRAQSAKKAPRITARIAQAQALPENRLRITLEDVRLAASGDDPLPGQCAWTWINPPPDAFPLPGQRVEISRPLRPVHYMVNDDANSAQAAMASRGVYWRMWSRGEAGSPAFSGKADWLAALRQSVRTKFLRALQTAGTDGENIGPAQLPQGKAILLALIFGDRGAMAQSTMDNFAAATLAHSLALSGQHLCVAGFLGMLLVISMARVKPDIYLSRPKIILIAAASIPFAIAYLWLGDGPASLVRASCMLFIAAIWLWRGMTFNTLDLLCAALCAILIFRPLAILETGLQLSALCIAIIGLTLPAISRLPFHGSHKQASLHKKTAYRAIQILIISLLIQLAMLPISLARFQIAGFWFPLNMLWLPVLGLAVLPLAALGLGLAAASPLLGQDPARLVLNIAALPCQFLAERLSNLRDIGFLAEPAFMVPHWTAMLAFAAIACALAWFFSASPTGRKKSACARVLGAALILLAIAPASRLVSSLDQNIKIEALDVGQGQAIYLQIPGNIRLLLDGGGFAGSSFDTGKLLVGPHISANASPRLDGVFNSHPDFDHLGGLFHILANFRVDKIFHNGQPAGADIGKKWENFQTAPNAAALSAGDRIILGNPANNICLEVLHPDNNKTAPNSGPAWSGNNASIILRLARNGKGLAIFPGDAEKSALKHLLKSGADLHADILFLPHHGSKGSFYPPFYKAVAPKTAAASCGFQNRWNYPAESIKKYFAQKNIPLPDTGNMGRITFVINKNDEIEITAARRNISH